MGFDNGQPTFSLQQVKIAKNNGDGTFGPIVIVPSVKIVGFDLKTISDQAEGDSHITAAAAQAISADINLEMAGLTFTALEIMTGLSHTSSTGKAYLTGGNFRFQYFGMVAQAWAAEGAGDTLLFTPKVKILSGFSWRLEYGKIVTPSFKAVALQDDFLGSEMWQLIERDAVASYTLPPV